MVHGEGRVHHARPGAVTEETPVVLVERLEHIGNAAEAQGEAQLPGGLREGLLGLAQAARIGLHAHHGEPPERRAGCLQRVQQRHLLPPRAQAHVDERGLLVLREQAAQHVVGDHPRHLDHRQPLGHQVEEGDLRQLEAPQVQVHLLGIAHAQPPGERRGEEEVLHVLIHDIHVQQPRQRPERAPSRGCPSRLELLQRTREQRELLRTHVSLPSPTLIGNP